MALLELAHLESDCKDAFLAPESLSKELSEELALWRARKLQTAYPLFHEFLKQPVFKWTDMVKSHRASSHPWYEFLRDKAQPAHFFSFLEEESLMPAFIPLLKRVEGHLRLPCSVEAIGRNLRDELSPTPHYQLFDRLLEAVRGQARGTLPHVDDLLVDTNLVYYYGHLISHAFAIGALFSTELMVPRRASCMALGLDRLGLNEYEIEFMTVHATSDIEHARDWLYEVLIPELSARPELIPEAAAGIALRLQTSSSYLDRLLLGASGSQRVHADLIEAYA